MEGPGRGAVLNGPPRRLGGERAHVLRRGTAEGAEAVDARGVLVPVTQALIARWQDPARRSDGTGHPPLARSPPTITGLMESIVHQEAMRVTFQTQNAASPAVAARHIPVSIPFMRGKWLIGW